ncbi:MAG: UTP--glucose-1-phosphate uridylyltransferase GalU [Acidobacteriota bacterium]|nr:UTP--glucose-1-phosphate uridylyltransferase GalU [Acidobacteriota bacterium]
MKQVRQAVIPAAGLGTRFLPATKAVPKEMLPIVDKPTIQYVVEEVVQSGLENVVLVTSPKKGEIEGHFLHNTGLEQRLLELGKKKELQMVEEIAEMVSVSSVRQENPLGLGHAVLVAQSLLTEEPFAVLLGDDIFRGDVPCLKQLLEAHQACQASVVAVMEVPPEAVSRYGVVAVEPVEGKDDRLYRVRGLVEKPAPEDAPSNLIIPGRYILTPGIFEALKATQPGAGGEIQLTDGLKGLIEKEPLYAYRFRGVRYDAGNKLEYLVATVQFALEHPEVGEEFRTYLKGLRL